MKFFLSIQLFYSFFLCNVVEFLILHFEVIILKNRFCLSIKYVTPKTFCWLNYFIISSIPTSMNIITEWIKIYYIVILVICVTNYSALDLLTITNVHEEFAA